MVSYFSQETGLTFHANCLQLTDWVEVLQPSPPIRVMSSRSVYLTTLFLGRLQAVNQYLRTFFRQKNCPSWISSKDRMTVENISWSIATKEYRWTRKGLNPRSPGHQSDAHPTEPPKPARWFPMETICMKCINSVFWKKEEEKHIISLSSAELAQRAVRLSILVHYIWPYSASCCFLQ